MVKEFNFRGLMAPVFNSFDNTKERALVVNNINQYAVYLKERGINGVLVNGTSGEGPIMSVQERKTVTEAWHAVCKEKDLTLMVQIGGAPQADVIELAKHAQSLDVDAVLCLPELYFKPNTIEQLVGYLHKIAGHCPNIPFLYYHIPMFTSINLPMPSFCDLAEEKIPNFVGLKYTSGDLAQGTECLKDNRSVFLGADTILSGAMVLGFNSAIMTTLNICPELATEIVKCIHVGRIPEARAAQRNLTARVKEILAAGGGDWVPSMKKAFNENKIGVNAGPVREPY